MFFFIFNFMLIFIKSFLCFLFPFVLILLKNYYNPWDSEQFMAEENSNPQTLDTGLACFAIMANFFEKPISIDQIKHKYDRQNSHFEEYELVQLAKEFSFKARFVETKWERLDKTALPAIAQSKDNTYFIIGKVAEDKVLLQDPAKGNYPEVLNK